MVERRKSLNQVDLKSRRVKSNELVVGRAFWLRERVSVLVSGPR